MDWPVWRIAVAGVRATAATIWTTWIMDVSAFPLAAATTRASPVPRATTSPVGLTVATPESAVLQLGVLASVPPCAS